MIDVNVLVNEQTEVANIKDNYQYFKVRIKHTLMIDLKSYLDNLAIQDKIFKCFIEYVTRRNDNNNDNKGKNYNYIDKTRKRIFNIDQKLELDDFQGCCR